MIKNSQHFRGKLNQYGVNFYIFEIIPEKIVLYLINWVLWAVYLYWSYKKFKVPVELDVAKQIKELKEDRELLKFKEELEELKVKDKQAYDKMEQEYKKQKEVKDKEEKNKVRTVTKIRILC